MSDPISSHLVDRVERSLRRRLHSEVRPHLLRCAARADSVDGFMAAAARLIVDTHDREAWLASWSPARRQRSAEPDADTDDAPDSTSPTPFDAAPSNFSLEPAAVEGLSQALAIEVGPMARRLVENEMQQSHSVSELLYRLQTHLDDDAQRQRFADAAMALLGR